MNTKLRKIFYVPGMISAMIIPLVFWHLGSEKLKEPIPNVMEFGIPAKVGDVPYDSTFEPYRNWKYKKIIVRPNSAKANSKYYVSELKKLNARNEEETGIEFILNDENSYGDFASILNDCAIAKHERYGVDLEKTGHLFALVDYKDPNIVEITNFFMCGTDGSMEYVEGSDYYKGFQKFQFQISELPKQAYYLIFSFLIFLQISVLGFIKRYF